MRITVIGAGGWGTALSLLLNRNSHEVTLWSYEKSVAENIIAFRENKSFLPGVTIPLEIKISTSLFDVINENNILVISVPVQFLRTVLEKIKDFDFSNKILCNTSKGLEVKSLMLPSQIIKSTLKKVNQNNIVTLSGPSHAEEVARNKPTNVVAASESINTARKIQRYFSNSNFGVETSLDIIGVELGSALKNIIAIGIGMCDGLEFGDNTKSGILIKGLNQIANLGVNMGAKNKTFYGLSGLGDLMVTCYSRHSRNRYVGEEIGKGRHLNEIIKSMKMVAEGVVTTKSTFQLLKKYKIRSVLVEEIYNVLYEHKSPHKAILDIMGS